MDRITSCATVRGVDTSSQLINGLDSCDWIGSNLTKRSCICMQGFASSRAHVPSSQQLGGAASLLAPTGYALYHHGASYGGGDRAAVAAWQQQQQLQCGSKGTGVFIPRSTPGSAHPKKKGKNRGAAAAAKVAARAAQATGAGAPPKKRV